MSTAASGPVSTRSDSGTRLTMACVPPTLAARSPAGKFRREQLCLPNRNCRKSWGVSRTVVREAIRHLASKGLVSVGPKVGTRVRPSTEWNMLDPEVMEWHLAGPASADFIAALYEMRLIFEPEAARLAASRISPAQRTACAGRACRHHLAAARFRRAHCRRPCVSPHHTGGDRQSGLRSFGAMIENSLSISFSLSWQKAETEQSLALHGQVADAISSGDEELAALQMRRLISFA